MALLGLAASVASVASAPIAPSAALGAILIGWLAHNWGLQPGGSRPPSRSSSPGAASSRDPDQPSREAAAAVWQSLESLSSAWQQEQQLRQQQEASQEASHAAASGASGWAPGRSFLSGSGWNMVPAHPGPHGSSSGSNSAPAVAAAVGGAGVGAGVVSAREVGGLPPRELRRQLAADGQETMNASRSTLLSMVQQIVNLRTSLGAQQLGQLQGQEGGGLQGSGSGGSGGPGGDEQPGEGGQLSGMAQELEERERVLRRALANVQRLTMLIRERDARCVVFCVYEWVLSYLRVRALAHVPCTLILCLLHSFVALHDYYYHPIPCSGLHSKAYLGHQQPSM